MAVIAVIIGFLVLQRAAATVSQDIEIQSEISVHMNNVVSIPFVLQDLPAEPKFTLVPHSESDIAKSTLHILTQNGTSFNGVVNITGVFLGRTELSFSLIENGVSYQEVKN